MIFILSLGFADLSSKNTPLLNFYSLHTRVWELIAGSILAYFEISWGRRSNYNFLNLVLPSIGLVLIIYSILFFNDEMFHPSFNTIFPIIGVCLIIWFSNKGEIITKLLSSKLFVGVGLISYSLYLWHYPVFAFARITDFTQQSAIFKNLFLGIIILILSLASYFFVERPFRNKKNQFKFIISLIISFILIIFIVNYKIIKNNGYKTRLQKY